MFSTSSERFTDECNFQDNDIIENCEVTTAFEHLSTVFGFELEDSKIRPVTER